MPARLIHHQQRVGLGMDLLTEVGQMNVHHVRVGRGHDPSVAFACGWTNSGEQICPFISCLANTARPSASVGPHPAVGPLLTKTSFIVKPKVDALVIAQTIFGYFRQFSLNCS